MIAKYIYASGKINSMVEDGIVLYEADWNGELIYYSYNTEYIDELKDELTIVDAAMK